jgi:hypothetical protein
MLSPKNLYLVLGFDYRKRSKIKIQNPMNPQNRFGE